MKIKSYKPLFKFDPFIFWLFVVIFVVSAGIIALAVKFSKETKEQYQQIQSNLPEGCEFKNLGPYGSITSVVMVRCKSQDATVTSYRESKGKTGNQAATVTIND